MSRSSAAATRSWPSAMNARTRAAASATPWSRATSRSVPLHGWEFDLRTGACMTVPGESVPQFTVTVEDGIVFLSEEPAS